MKIKQLLRMVSFKFDETDIAKLKYMAEEETGGNMSYKLRKMIRNEYDAKYRLTEQGRAALEETKKGEG